MERTRPDPDELLTVITDEDQQAERGRLKIFLGYAAGVGKTYAMLNAARERQAEGTDVLIGYVETHGRPETERLLEGMPILERRRIPYRGTTLPELDLDGLLERAPELALVDELAHTNAPGSRHPKRYQDVRELLEAGIDVYTTLNVQHLESYNDVVAQITGIRVHETVPDLILDGSTTVELVDLPPDELRRRLAEGKVYVPQQAAAAAERFFRVGNLTALREMALRRAAQQVDAQMLTYMQAQAIPGPWAATERLMVAVGPSPLSERLIRATRRMADEMKADWVALFVETPAIANRPGLSERALANLALAERLGARVAHLTGPSVEDTLAEQARRHNVTKIIAGKPVHSRWRELFRRSLVDRIIRASGGLDVYVISSGDAPAVAPPARTRPLRSRRRYLYGLPPVVLATLLGWPLSERIEPTNLAMPYLAAVVVAAVYLGRGPAVLSAVLSVLAFDFFMVPPRYTMGVDDTQYLVTFLGLFVVGLVVSSLAARVREQAQAARRRELHTGELYELSRELAGAANAEAITLATQAHVRRVMGGETVVLLREGERLKEALGSPAVADDECAVATWALLHSQAAGRGTDTLPKADMLYLPLFASRGIMGVLGFGVAETASPMSAVERRVLEAITSLAALALERAELAAAANQLELLQATEALQAALLNSISHELRTPLSSIAGVLSTLRAELGEDGTPYLDHAARKELIETAWQEADELNRSVGNLLDMTRLESGAIRVALDALDVEDLVGSALTLLEARIGEREVAIDIPSKLPQVVGDSVLVTHVIVNVLDNALAYSAAGSPLFDQGPRTGG